MSASSGSCWACAPSAATPSRSGSTLIAPAVPLGTEKPLPKASADMPANRAKGVTDPNSSTSPRPNMPVADRLRPIRIIRSLPRRTDRRVEMKAPTMKAPDTAI